MPGAGCPRRRWRLERSYFVTWKRPQGVEIERNAPIKAAPALCSRRLARIGLPVQPPKNNSFKTS
jgi:hypothetical protein